MTLVNFVIRKSGDITPEDRIKLLEITEIIESGLDDLYEQSMNQIVDYQALLNFVMSINSEYYEFILLKVSDKVPVPHLSVIKQNLLEKQGRIKVKMG